MAAGAGCGKKGPPLAPFVLLPEAPTRVAAQRIGDDVYLTLTLPLQNIDKSKPADVRRVEVYAFTATTPPVRARMIELGRVVATVPVAAAVAEGALVGQRPRTPETKDAVQPGATITIKDTLTADAFVPRSLPAPPAPPVPASKPALPIASPPPGILRRFYVAVAFSDRGRPGVQSAPVELPLTAVPDPPTGLQVEYTADATVLTWQPSGGFLGFLLDNAMPLETLREEDPQPAADPLALPPGPTRYHVYRIQAPDPLVLPSPAAGPPPGTEAAPRPITALPLDDLTFFDSVGFDRERCYEVRAVRGLAADAIESAPTERYCLMEVDVFAPAPPTNLATVVREGAIDLVWESSPDTDVWGYVILRGAAGDATLQPLNVAPVIETQFTDTTVTAGTRYVYAVMAVDSRLPVPNVSAASDSIEETAR